MASTRKLTLPKEGAVIFYERKKRIFIANVGFIHVTAHRMYVEAHRSIAHKGRFTRGDMVWFTPFASWLESVSPSLVQLWGLGNVERVADGSLPQELFFDPSVPRLVDRLGYFGADELREISNQIANALPLYMVDQDATFASDSSAPRVALLKVSDIPGNLFADTTPVTALRPAPKTRKARAPAKTVDPSTIGSLADAYTPEIIAEFASGKQSYGRASDELKTYYGIPGYSSLEWDNAKRKMADKIKEKTVWNTLSLEEKAKLYFSTMAAVGFDPQDENLAREYLYGLSMFCPKPDPLGRYILCDVFARKDRDNSLIKYSGDYGTMQTIITYAGVKTPLALGAGGPTMEDAEEYEGEAGKEEFTGKYLRMHSPEGVKVRFAGFGTVLYGGTAVIANMENRYIGTWSSGRSALADEWWERARKTGIAIGNKTVEYEEQTDVRKTLEICPPELRNQKVWAYAEGYYDVTAYSTLEELLAAHPNANRSLINETTMDKVCFNSYVQFPKFRTPPAYVRAVDLLPTENVLATNLIPFIANHPVTGLSSSPRVDQGTAWNPVVSNAAIAEKTRLSDKNEALFKTASTSETTAELLARASFGASPRLALFVFEALNKNGHAELAKQYLARKDIAALLAGNTTALGLLQTRALHSFRGMSSRLAGYVLSGLSEGLDYDAPVNPQNPLNLPEMPASIRRKLDGLALDS